MSYSLKQCKEDMIAMWSWLAENPSCSKAKYIDTLSEEEGRRIGDMKNECPCCEYAGPDDDNSDPICKECPIEQWGAAVRCFLDGSPFDIWNSLLTCAGAKRKAAWEIVELAKKIVV